MVRSCVFKVAVSTSLRLSISTELIQSSRLSLLKRSSPRAYSTRVRVFRHDVLTVCLPTDWLMLNPLVRRSGELLVRDLLLLEHVHRVCYLSRMQL